MRKTVLINCSPKKSMSVSGFIAGCFRHMLGGEKVCMQLRTPGDHEAILKELETADKLVFTLPLYVDSVPSHMLPFLKKLEAFSREHSLKLKVYAIANNGFIEGRQNEPLMQVLENFCGRSGLVWCGGIGIGGGVMLNVTRIMLTVVFFLTVLNTVINGIQGQDVLSPIVSFGISLLENTVLCCGIIAYTVRLAVHVNRGTAAGKKYTRIMLPSFIFIPVTDIFFTIISIFRGGFFRGWFKKYAQTEDCGIMVTKNQSSCQ